VRPPPGMVYIARLSAAFAPPVCTMPSECHLQIGSSVCHQMARAVCSLLADTRIENGQHRHDSDQTCFVISEGSRPVQSGQTLRALRC